MFETIIKKKKTLLIKRPVSVGNSQGFRIKKEELKLLRDKYYVLIILEVENERIKQENGLYNNCIA